MKRTVAERHRRREQPLARLQEAVELSRVADRRPGDAGLQPVVDFAAQPVAQDCFHAVRPRSEEHTSELQSLMRISYAVFCLKKKLQRHNKALYPQCQSS